MRAMLTDAVEFSNLAGNIAHGFGTNFITMGLRPSNFDGLLSVPIVNPAAGPGFVDINLDFSIFDSLPNGALNLLHHRAFHKQLSSVEDGVFQVTSNGPG